MKKQMEKLQVRINQNLHRTEKSVALPHELEKIGRLILLTVLSAKPPCSEETVLVYKQVCSTLHKKLCEFLPSAGKGTDGQSIERRLKKTPDFLLGQSLSDQGRVLSKQSQSASCLGQVLLEAGGVCTSLGHDLVQYEIQVEHIIQQLDVITKTELPAILKARRGLDQLVLELDTAKARLAAAKLEAEQAGVITGGDKKLDKCGEELDDAERKVEMARDSLASDMMTFLAKDAELAGMISRLLEHKLEYHQSLTDQLRLTQPKIELVLESRRGYPLFGSSLSSHLSNFHLPSGIAWPLQLCVSRLVSLGLEEEGLFRLAAGQGKVKRLRAELETPGLNPLPSLETCTDHHLLTATIKSYLRELPEPLLGAQLYPDWLEAGRTDCEEKRFDLVWNLLQHETLPRENYRNIQYLFRLLHEVGRLEERNKMSPSNLAIVITPNVVSSLALSSAVSLLLSLDMGGGGARHPGYLHRELPGPGGGADHQSVSLVLPERRQSGLGPPAASRQSQRERERALTDQSEPRPAQQSGGEEGGEGENFTMRYPMIKCYQYCRVRRPHCLQPRVCPPPSPVPATPD